MAPDFSLDHLDPGDLLPEPQTHRFHATARALKTCLSRVELLYSEVGREIENDLYAKLEDADAEVLSFDVFDTLLLRNNKPEALRYHELAQMTLNRLRTIAGDRPSVEHLQVEDILEARIFGMQATYHTRALVQGCGEGLIDEVLRAQLILLGLDGDLFEVFIGAEVDYEVENLTVNPVLVALAERFCRQGRKLILVSDTYLPARLIERIIDRLMRYSLHDHLYSSADTIITKHSGKMFPNIATEMGTEPGRFFHLGDSWIGDVVRSREAGWQAHYFPVSDQERDERTRNLAAFIEKMDLKGLEARSWAKL